MRVWWNGIHSGFSTRRLARHVGSNPTARTSSRKLYDPLVQQVSHGFAWVLGDYVAQRTNPSGRANIEVSVAIRDELNSYKAALHREMGRRASAAEIIAALLKGVPLWQAVAMLDAYRPTDNPGASTGKPHEN
jgi:hypothetical protein